MYAGIVAAGGPRTVKGLATSLYFVGVTVLGNCILSHTFFFFLYLYLFLSFLVLLLFLIYYIETFHKILVGNGKRAV